MQPLYHSCTIQKLDVGIIEDVPDEPVVDAYAILKVLCFKGGIGNLLPDLRFYDLYDAFYLVDIEIVADYEQVDAGIPILSENACCNEKLELPYPGKTFCEGVISLYTRYSEQVLERFKIRELFIEDIACALHTTTLLDDV